jgi:hypothetical protein
MVNAFKPLRFWLPLGNGIEQEILILGHYVQTIILPAAEHEAAHLVVAHHYGAHVLGVAIGFIPERSQSGMLVHAVFQHSTDWSMETRCTVMAAGPAADLLVRGAVSESGASGDLHDIEALTGVASLEPYMTTAKDILIEKRIYLGRIAAALRGNLLKAVDHHLGPMPYNNNRVGTWLLEGTELMDCFNAPLIPTGPQPSS